MKIEKISAKFTLEKIEQVTKPIYKTALLKRLQENNGDPKKAFAGINSLSKKPVLLETGETIPNEVKTQYFETIYTIRKLVNADNFKDLKSLQKVQDLKIREILENRLEEFGGEAKEAFSDLDKNPLWLNKEKGIKIKRVAISGVSNVETLHHKRDHFGTTILGENGVEIPSDFVSTGNNHHVAIYSDKNGKLHDNIVSFYEAVSRVNAGLPIVDMTLNESLGWKFLYTMKQNEMFIFPNDDFNPKEIDLLDIKNRLLISKNLFRVQKLSKVDYGNSAVRDYVFRHHLETKIEDNKALKNITYVVCKSLPLFKDIVKVRLNHLGDIVHRGEY